MSSRVAFCGHYLYAVIRASYGKPCGLEGDEEPGKYPDIADSLPHMISLLPPSLLVSFVNAIFLIAGVGGLFVLFGHREKYTFLRDQTLFLFACSMS